MAGSEAREDIVQMTVAAHDAAPDAAMMRELEAIVDGGGSLLDVAEALTADERWTALYPPSQTPAEFSDAWLETLLPGVSAELLAFGRGIVVPALDAGPAGLVLAAQDFLSAPGAPADFADFAAAFLERSAAAMEALLDSEAVEDLVQLTVAAYDAAPGAALVAELEAVTDGGGSLLDAAEALTADERWTALYPPSQTPAEFSDAWLGNLLPGADASLLAVGREVVVPHLEAGESAAGLVLAAQQFLSGSGVSAPFDVFARAFLNKAQVAAAHSVTEALDGSAAELREVLDSVTGDDATVRAAIDALDDQMPGGGGSSGGGSSGGGSSGGGSSGGGSSGGGSSGGGSSGGGSSGGGSGGGGTSGGGSGGGGASGGGSGGGGASGGGSGGGGASGGGSGGGGTSGGGSSGGQTPVAPSSRDSTDDQGRVVLTEFDDDRDGVHDRAEAYEYGSHDLIIKTTWYDDWAVKADGAGKDLAEQTIDRILTVADDNHDGSAESRQRDSYDADGETITESLFDTDADGAWERGEGYEYDASARLVLKKTGTDPGSAPIAYGEAEIYILDAAGGTAEIRFFDAYDGTSDFIMLSAAPADRIHYFGVELDADGSDDARHEKLDASGRLVEVLFDIDADGTDRAESYAWDVAGRKTEIRFFDPYTGATDLSGEMPDRIYTWTYDSDTGDTRHRSFSEDLDGDGNVDRKTTVTYHGSGAILATEQKDYDDGTGGKAVDDGTVDRSVHKTFGPSGSLESIKYDDDGDGVWARADIIVSRDQTDDRGRTVLTEFDSDNDGTHERAVAYEYGARDLKTKATWYDDWALEADGTGKALAEQTISRRLTVTDADGNGTGESRQHDAYGADGETVIESLFDTDNIADGSWERAEGYEYDASGRPALVKTGVVTGTEPESATVAYGGAEIYILDAAGGTAEVRFFDAYDGTSDFAMLSDAFADRIRYFGVELDADGNDDARHEKLDAAGRAVEVLFDIDADGVDRAEAYVWDAAGRKTEARFFDPYAGTFGLSGETPDRILGWTYDADGEIASTRYDDDGDGDWDRTEEAGARYQYDGGNRQVLAEFDDDGDGTHERAEAYEYGAGNLKTKTSWYDDWALKADGSGKDLAGQTIDRTLTVADGDGDGTGESSRRDLYDAAGALVVESLFDDDFDGTTDRAAAHEYDGGGSKTTTRFYDSWAGTFGLPAGGADRIWTYDSSGRVASVVARRDDDGDGTWDRARRDAKDEQGRVALSEFDDDGDGTHTRAEAYEYGAGDVLIRTDYYDDWDENNDAAAQHADRALHVMLDLDGDGASDDSRTDVFDDWGRTIRIKYNYDSNRGIDRIEEYTYSPADGGDARWLTFSEDADGDGTTDLRTAVTYHGASGVFATRRTDHDDGTGTGAADDGDFDKSRFETFGSGGGVVSIKHDDDGDGIWDRTIEVERQFKDSHGRLVRIEIDDDKDGTYDRAEIYIWTGAGKSRIDYYDDWNQDANAVAQQASKSVYLMEDLDGDGASDDSRTETFDDEGRAVRTVYDHGADGTADRIVASAFVSSGREQRRIDVDADGTFDRGEVLDLRNGGRLIRQSFDPDPADGTFTRQESYGYNDFGQRNLAKFDAGHDDSYEMAEEYRYGAGGVLTRTLYYDRYDETEALVDQVLSRSTWLLQDYDGDGSDDDSKSETFDDDGRPVRVAYDYDANGKVNLIEAWTYSGATATQVRELDDGMGSGAGGAAAGDGAIDRRVEETRESGILIRTRIDTDNDGTWDETADIFPRYTVEDGRLVGARYDGDGDGTADRIETYTRNAAGIVTKRTVELDDGSGGAAAGDGVSDRVREETWTDGMLAKVRFDDDGDGTWERTFVYAHERGSRPSSVKYEEDADDNGAAEATLEFSILYGTDGDDAIKGTDADEWIVAGKGDDVVTGGGGRDWFIFREGDGKDRLTDFKPGETGPDGDKDRVWIARGESGLDLDDFTARDMGGAAGVSYDYGGQGDWVWFSGWQLESLGKAGYYRHGEAAAAPGAGARDVTRDAAGRVTEVRHFHAWDGVAELGGLPAGRIHRYAYDGGRKEWKTVTMNDNAGADEVFETRVTAFRDAAGGITGRLFKYDDGSNGGTADDGTFDRSRRDEFDAEGRVVKILHDSDLDGVWNYIDVYTYETGDSQPTTRRGRRTDTMDDDNPANDKTSDLARLVFGTDGDDHRGDLKLIGNRWQHDWFMPGRGDDRVDGGRGAGDDQQGRDVHIFRYGDGVNVVQGFGPEGSSVHDTIWIAEEEFSTADVRVIKNVTLTPSSVQADHPEIPAHVFPDSGGDDVKVTVLAYGGGPGDRIVLEGWDSDDADYFRARFVSVPADIVYDPHSFAYGSRNDLHTRDEDGKATEVRVYDAWDGVDAGDAPALEPDRVTTHVRTYHSDGATLATLLTETDGVGGPADGSIDRRVEEAYDTSGELVRTRYDDDGDGRWNRIEEPDPDFPGEFSVSRNTYDDRGRLWIEETGSKRGSTYYYEGHVYEYEGATDVKVQAANWNQFYWNRGGFLRGDLDPPDSVELYRQTLDDVGLRDDILLIADPENDLSKREYHDYGGDGLYDKVVGKDYYGPGHNEETESPGAILLILSSVTFAGDSADRANVNFYWDMEERYTYGDGDGDGAEDADHNIRIDFYEGVSPSAGYKGTADVDDRRLAARHHFLQDYDGVGGTDDSKFEVFDAEGDLARIAYDYDSDGAIERMEDHTLGETAAVWLLSRDASGRVEEARHFADWDGVADPAGLSADRVHKYVYDGAERYWKSILIDADVDGVFETKVTVARDAEGAATHRTFEFDDGSGGGAAEDGAFDRKREDRFDGSGRVSRILLDADNDGTWDYVNRYNFGIATPRVRQIATMDDADDANDVTSDQVRLVFGTKGDDQGSGQLSGSNGNDWFIPGPGNDTIAGGQETSKTQGDDVFVFQSGDGVNVIRGYGPPGSNPADSVLILDDGFDTADVKIDYHGDIAGQASKYPGIQSGLFSGGVDGTVLTFGGEDGDRIVFYGWNLSLESFWQAQLSGSDAPHDPRTYIYGFRNTRLTRDDEGRVTQVLFYDTWDGIGAGVGAGPPAPPDRIHRYTYEGSDTAWKTYQENNDAAADLVFEHQLAATRDADGRIIALSARGSTVGVKLDGMLAGNAGELTVITTALDDAVANTEIAGGSKDDGTLGSGQIFILGGGMDAFTVRRSADTEDAFDGAGMQTKSAPRLTVDAGDGDDVITAPVDVTGAVDLDGGKGDDVLKFASGDSGRAAVDRDGHLVRFDGGAGDDTLLIEADAGGGAFAPRAFIENVENIHLELADTGEDGSLAMRLLVSDGFDDAITVTSRSAATLAAADLGIRFALAPDADGGSVDVGNIDVSGIDAAARPRIGVEGGRGDDVLTGGTGPTTFRFQEDLGSAGGDDIVRGYSAAEGDVIEIVGGGVKDGSTAVAADGADTKITYILMDGGGAGTGHTITVVGVNAGVSVMSETTGGLAAIPYTT